MADKEGRERKERFAALAISRRKQTPREQRGQEHHRPRRRVMRQRRLRRQQAGQGRDRASSPFLRTAL
eukprot:gene48230-8903_t